MCVCAHKPPAKSGLDFSQVVLLCDSPSKSRNGRGFGLGGDGLVGVSSFHPVLFSAGPGFKPRNSPHPLTAAQLGVSRDPARGSPPPLQTTGLRLGGALELEETLSVSLRC